MHVSNLTKFYNSARILCAIDNVLCVDQLYYTYMHVMCNKLPWWILGDRRTDARHNQTKGVMRGGGGI